MNWYNLYDRIEIVVENFRMFVLVLSVPTSFYATVMIFTAEKEHIDTKAYFLDMQRVFFTLLFVFLTLNWVIIEITNDQRIGLEYLNYITAILLLANIAFKHLWLRMLALIYLFGLFGFNLYNS